MARFRGFKIDSGNCPNGCARCKHYPYFHFIPTKDGSGQDIEYIKDITETRVINHSTNQGE